MAHRISAALLLAVALAAASLAPGRALAQAAPPPSDAPARAETDDAEVVREVRVEGNRRVEAEAVRRALVTKQGQPYEPTRSADDLRAVWSLGYFDDVRLLAQRLPQGGIAYVVQVTERPTVNAVRLEGNEELSNEDLKEQLGDIKLLAIVDTATIASTVKKVQEKYVEKGYFLSEVTHRLDPRDDGSVDVVIVVRENAKVMVKEIRLLGAEQVPAELLRSTMLTKEGGYLSFLTGEGNYREEVFQRDVAVIQSVYYDRGFINVQVEKPDVSMSADKRYIYITIRIKEGEPFTVGKLDVGGDLIVPRENLLARLRSRTGQRFNRSQLSADIGGLTDVYYDRGYAYANVIPRTDVDPEKKTVDLTFEIQQGKQVTVERIDIVGNTKTRDQVIRRELRTYEGELFSGTGLRRSKERVTALGFFETVEVSQRPGSADDLIVIQVEVKEKATGTFQIGLGFSSLESFIFTAQVSQNNFVGWGQTVSASAQISGVRSLVQLSFYDPYFLDSNYLLSADFFRTQSDYQGFIRNSTGGSVGLGRYLLEDLNVGLAYSLEFVEVEAGSGVGQVQLADQFRSGTTSSLRLSTTWDRRDNRLFPTNGSFNQVSVETAPSLLGGSFNFNRYSANNRLYFPLGLLGMVFKTNTTLGYIQEMGDKSLPISELFYLGGINSVRGYLLRTITPTRVVGRPGNRPDAGVYPFGVGGDKQFILTAELELPILEKLGVRGVLFYDAGNAFARDERLFQDKQDDVPLGLFHSAGFGIRWFSPVGPLRFEWGIPLTPRPEDKKIGMEFTIGNAF